MELQKLKNFGQVFSAFSQDYIVIGGHACALNYQTEGFSFRQTADIDIVIVIENWSKEFSHAISTFLSHYGYSGKKAKTLDDSPKYVAYRFEVEKEVSEKEQIPLQIELFAPQGIDVTPLEKGHLGLLPPFESTSDLGAILTDEGCYQFIMASRVSIDSIPTVNAECLVALKAFAYIANHELINTGKLDAKQTPNADKHITDLNGLTALIKAPFTTLPASLNKALRSAITRISTADEQTRLNTLYQVNGMPQLASLLTELLAESNTLLVE